MALPWFIVMMLSVFVLEFALQVAYELGETTFQKNMGISPFVMTVVLALCLIQAGPWYLLVIFAGVVFLFSSYLAASLLGFRLVSNFKRTLRPA